MTAYVPLDRDATQFRHDIEWMRAVGAAVLGGTCRTASPRIDLPPTIEAQTIKDTGIDPKHLWWGRP